MIKQNEIYKVITLISEMVSEYMENNKDYNETIQEE